MKKIPAFQLAEQARKLAYQAHSKQFRWDGITPYIEHPEAVAKNFKDPYYRAVALLHDVIEDTRVTEDKLIELRFPDKVIDAVLVLTKPKRSTNYLKYILKVKKNDIAREVKIKDIEDNLKTTSKEKKDKYRLALHILKSC